MDLFESIRARRSIRRFTSTPVTTTQLTLCLEAARLAPSGTNSQPWKFLVLRDPERRTPVAEAGYNQACLREAPVLTLLLGDRKIFKKRLRRGKELVSIGAVDPTTMETVDKVYRERKESKDDIDRAILANAMIAGEHYCLAATAQGLGTCWVMLFDPQAVILACALPDHLFPIALLPTGVPNQTPEARPRYGLDQIAADETLDAPWADEA